MPANQVEYFSVTVSYTDKEYEICNSVPSIDAAYAELDRLLAISYSDEFAPEPGETISVPESAIMEKHIVSGTLQEMVIDAANRKGKDVFLFHWKKGFGWKPWSEDF